MPVRNDPMPRRAMLLTIMVDASSSMAGSKIGAVNDAIRNVLPIASDISVNNNDAEILIAVQKFSSTVEWIYSEPKSVSDFEWLDIQAGGLTSMGEACRELSRQLDEKSYMKRELGHYAPAIILMSDGHPTDDFAKGLEVLKQNPWFQKSIRVAIAIGNDANKEALARFCPDKECVFDVHDIESLRNVIHLAVVSSVVNVSHSASATDTTKQQQVVEDMKKGISDQNTDTDGNGMPNPAEPQKDNWSDWD